MRALYLHPSLRLTTAIAPIAAVVAMLAMLATSASAEQFEFKDVAGQHLDIMRDGKPLIRYMYAFDASTPETRHDTYKVYHHVFDPTGKQLITKGPGGKFTHHRGLFIGFARTQYDGKSYDLWHMKDQCNLLHQKFLAKETDGKTAKLSSLIHWDIGPDKTILEEHRTVTIHASESAHLLADWTSELKAVAGDVLLKADPEHGGMQYRPANAVAENKSAAYVFPKEGTDPKRDKDLSWVALTYKLGDATYTVQDMRGPNNPGNSVFSAYRDYGRFGNYFETTVKDGQTLKLQYRFRITTGAAPTRKELDSHYQAMVESE